MTKTLLSLLPAILSSDHFLCSFRQRYRARASPQQARQFMRTYLDTARRMMLVEHQSCMGGRSVLADKTIPASFPEHALPSGWLARSHCRCVLPKRRSELLQSSRPTHRTSLFYSDATADILIRKSRPPVYHDALWTYVTVSGCARWGVCSQLVITFASVLLQFIGAWVDAISSALSACTVQRPLCSGSSFVALMMLIGWQTHPSGL